MWAPGLAGIPISPWAPSVWGAIGSSIAERGQPARGLRHFLLYCHGAKFLTCPSPVPGESGREDRIRKPSGDWFPVSRLATTWLNPNRQQSAAKGGIWPESNRSSAPETLFANSPFASSLERRHALARTCCSRNCPSKASPANFEDRDGRCCQWKPCFRGEMAPMDSKDRGFDAGS